MGNSVLTRPGAARTPARTNTLTVRVPSGATALVNVTGTTARVADMGFDLGEADAGHVLYTFADATDLTLSGVGVEGSILAPRASVSFTSGVITGTLVAGTLNGPGQANLAPFTGCLPAGEASRA